MDEDLQGIIKRKAERELFDRKKTLQLQDDEISRLRSELEMISQQISDSQEHLDQIGSIHRRKINELTQELATIPSKTSVIKTQNISSHTARINAMQQHHTQSMAALRETYEKKLNAIHQTHSFSSHAQAPDDLIDQIENTRSQIADLLQQKAEKQELRIQEKLQKIKAQIEIDQKKEKELRATVEKLRIDVAEAIKQAEKRTNEKQQISEHRMKLATVDHARYEERTLLQRANAIAAENNFRDDASSQIEEKRGEINRIKAKSDKLKLLINESKTEDSDAIQQATNDLEIIKKEHHNLLKKQEDIKENGTIKGFKREKIRRKGIYGDLKNAHKELQNVQYENSTLLDEVRRLDFMIYGRRGQFQIPKKIPISARR